MDDQVIGVSSEAQGLRVLSAIQDSLASLYLTPNAKKSVVLSLADAKIHFHLDTNAELDGLEAKLAAKSVRRLTLVRELTRAWRIAMRNEDKGQWEQIQKRIYRLAGLTKGRFLRRRAISDLLQNPGLAERISSYMRCSGSAAEYLRFTSSVVAHRQQIHQDVPLLLFESLLRMETRGFTARRVLQRAETVLEEVLDGRRPELFAAAACLLILRFGSRRDLSLLRPCFRDRRKALPSDLIRAAATVYASEGKNEFNDVRRSAAVLLLNPLALMVRLGLRIMKFSEVPDRYKARLHTRYDPLTNQDYLDMRTLVAARLLALNRRKSIRLWLKSWALSLSKRKLSAFDKRLLARLVP
jgi:hypothetical protein